jgi:hypothetical protein
MMAIVVLVSMTKVPLDASPRHKRAWARNMTVPKHHQMQIFVGCYSAADGTSAAARRKWRPRYIAILWAGLKRY